MISENGSQVMEELMTTWKDDSSFGLRYKSFSLLDPTKEETMKIFRRNENGTGKQCPSEIQTKVDLK